MLDTDIKFHIIEYGFLLFAGSCIVASAVRYLRQGRIALLHKVSLVVSGLGLLAIADMYYAEPNWIRTDRVTISDPALAGILDGVRVVQISDMHVEESLGYRERKLIEKVNELSPDILLITGDFFSDHKTRDSAAMHRTASDLIRSFKVKLGIYGVVGNYDHFRNAQEREAFTRSAGVHILSKESREIQLPGNKSLWLAGLDGSWDRDTKADIQAKLRKTLAHVPDNAPVILIYHYPDIFGEANRAGVNLVLAGHTHGGQIGIPFLIHMSDSANKSTFMSGLFDAGKTKMYVNRGIGTTNVPIRLFCRPEITEFKFTN